MWQWVGFAALVVVSLLVWWVDPSLRHLRRFAADLKDREPLSDAAMVSGFFAATDIEPEVPAQVRLVFGKHMGYPAEKLRPDDDLEFFWAELDMSGLIKELESVFGITIMASEAAGTPCTIRGVSLLVARKAGRTGRC